MGEVLVIWASKIVKEMLYNGKVGPLMMRVVQLSSQRLRHASQLVRVASCVFCDAVVPHWQTTLRGRAPMHSSDSTHCFPQPDGRLHTTTPLLNKIRVAEGLARGSSGLGDPSSSPSRGNFSAIVEWLKNTPMLHITLP